MSNTNETITDIIRKIRAEADSIEASVRGSLKAGEGLNGVPFTESDLEPALDLVMTKRKEADRLEAALGREKAAIEADALTVGGTVEALRATAENPSAVGNMAAMRKTLEEMAAELEDLASREGIRAPAYSSVFSIYAEKCRKALAAPRLNCEVGTVQEQSERFRDYCEAHKDRYAECLYCPLVGETGGHCELAWAQLACESEVKK